MTPSAIRQQTLALLEAWGKMEDAGFTFRQLNYLIRNQDDALRPLAPAPKTILLLTKTLYDGLNAIDRDHPDVEEANKDAATAELIRTKAGLLFDQSVVEQMIGLLEGTAVYSTNAPENLVFTIPDSLARKIKYSNQKTATPPIASVQITGILTEDEQNQAKTLSSDPGWAKAIDRAGKQPLNVFNDVLFGIFSENKIDAIKNLLAGDVNVPLDRRTLPRSSPTPPRPSGFYFLRHFLPFLRRRLTHRLIVDTLSGAAGLSGEVTDVLLLGDIGRWLTLPVCHECAGEDQRQTSGKREWLERVPDSVR